MFFYQLLNAKDYIMFNIRTLYRLRRIIKIMLPVLATQISIIGMNFFDATMSGHAGAVQLAGSSIGGSLMMPIIASSTGILMAATPIIAHLIGKDERQNIGSIIRAGLVLAFSIEFILLATYYLFIDLILVFLNLEPEVAHIAKYYILALILGLSGGLVTFPLRSLTDTVASTAVSMKIYLLALPINALLNYCFIFGNFGAPELGGIGAGVATAITYYILLAIFLIIVWRNKHLQDIKILPGKISFTDLKEYLAIGIPNGLGIFMEASLFGFIIIFISKFGTNFIAAHQAAMSFSSVLYMFPLSYSMALTIIVGIEVGAKRYREAKRYAHLGLIISFLGALCLIIVVYFNRDFIAGLYATDTLLLNYIQLFLIYTVLWQLFDAIACPIQGILRGYKDVKTAFYVSMLAYWGICLPLGLVLDYYFNQGAYAYWQGMVTGILVSAILLYARLRYIEKKFS